MLWNKDDLGMTLRYQASADAAKSLGTAVLPLGVAEPDDFGDAFAAMDREHPDAILMVADALTLLNRKRVFDYAAAHRLPAIYEFDLFVRDGGLMSYGANFRRNPSNGPLHWSIGFSRAPSLPICRSRNRRVICLWST